MDKFFKYVGILAVFIIALGFFESLKESQGTGSGASSSGQRVLVNKTVSIKQDAYYSVKFELTRPSTNVFVDVMAHGSQPFHFYLVNEKEISRAQMGLNFNYYGSLSGKSVLKDSKSSRLGPGTYGLVVLHGIDKGIFDSEKPAANVEVRLATM